LKVHAEPTIFEPLLSKPVNKYLSKLFKVDITSDCAGTKTKISCSGIIMDASLGINRQVAGVAVAGSDARHC